MGDSLKGAQRAVHSFLLSWYCALVSLQFFCEVGSVQSFLCIDLCGRSVQLVFRFNEFRFSKKFLGLLNHEDSMFSRNRT